MKLTLAFLLAALLPAQEYSLGPDSQSQSVPKGVVTRYTLEPGKTFSGVSSEINGDPPRVTVEETGRTYKMKEGHHKFWWMTKEKRIGLDFNVD